MAGPFLPGDSASWWTQINLTSAIEAQANGGAGITLALVDTGVVPSQPEVSGRVSAASSCAALTFTCSNGFVDDEGHGTATASIAAGDFNVNDLMSGVAPAATILEEKALDSQGSGFDTDVANGIVQAANHGAQVISLSLTYIPTQAVVDAINYAASKGIYIVWAGGNSSQPLNGGQNTTGLTNVALSHLIVVGSVDANNNLSSFSNTPGAGFAVGASSSASYASLWLMAPGENIIAPGIQFGANAYAFWTGTSMSTPEVAGAIALLEATWPILKTNGEATAVLFASATHLGATGVNQTFGNGLLNITAAFQPIGPMSVATGAGLVGVANSGSSTITVNGALGSLPFVRKTLSHYTAFDVFERNFSVNLSGLVATSGRSPNAQASYAPPLRSDNLSSAVGRFEILGSGPPSFAQSVFGAQGDYGFADPFATERGEAPAYFSFAGRDGTFAAAGHGVASALSFAQAAWGADSLVARQDGELGVASALTDLAQGGYFASVGARPIGPFRIAASFTASPPPIGSALAGDRTRSSASAGAISVTATLSRRWALGMTYSSLREDNALLGSTYAAGGLLDLGDRRQSRLLGLSSAFDLGHGRALLAEASYADTGGAKNGAGLISEVSPLKSMAWGVSFIQAGAFKTGDALQVSVRQPLRVVSGQAQMAVTGVDALGYPVTSFEPVSLVPSGRETDVGVSYATPVSAHASFRGQVQYRSDAENTAGLNDVALRLGLNLAF